jgi:hypothetical protein
MAGSSVGDADDDAAGSEIRIKVAVGAEKQPFASSCGGYQRQADIEEAEAAIAANQSVSGSAVFGS